MLSESLQSRSTVHLLGPTGELRDHIVDGQGHAAHQEAAAHTLPQRGHALPPVQVHDAGQKVERMQVVAFGGIEDLTLPPQNNERMAQQVLGDQGDPLNAHNQVLADRRVCKWREYINLE